MRFLACVFLVMTVLAGPALGQERVYDAFVTRVIDGDTFVARIDFGDRTEVERVRMADIDAPEVRGEEREAGLRSSRFLRDLIEREWVVLIVHTYSDGRPKRGKYRRLIARVFLGEEDVGALMVAEGLAEYY